MRLSIGMLHRARPVARWAAVLLLLLCSASALPAGAEVADGPAETSRQRIAAAIRILNDPAYQATDQKRLQRERLFAELADWFDFTEFSKRVLAEKWAHFTQRERTEFVDAFARFLGMYYLGELQKRYSDERVRVETQVMTGPTRARVTATLVWRDRAIPVEIRKHRSRGRWRVYDLSVFGISAVQVYRAQLTEIMRTHSPAEVIALVKSRIDE